MDVTATLAVFGQLAVSLTGFAGLLTAFDSGHDGWTAAEVAALRNLFLNSVGALAFSVAPIPFLSGGVDPDMVMSIACLALALYFTALFIGAIDYVFRLKGKPRSLLIYWGFTLGEAPLAATPRLRGVRRQAPLAPSARFCAGSMWLLAMGTAQFIFQIFWSLQAAGKR